MNTVLCFKWGTKYSSQYVNNLFRAFTRKVTMPFQFVCITDDAKGLDSGIRAMPLLDSNCHGWWQKVTAFKNPLHDITGTVLLIDLDMVIIDNIDCFFELPGDFIMEKDYIPRNGLSTCVIRFEANKHCDIYDQFSPNMMKQFWGDQVWVTQKRPNAQTWPDSWVKSYKWECLKVKDQPQSGFNPPKECKIIKFHGLPTIVDVQQYDHINKYWY